MATAAAEAAAVPAKPGAGKLFGFMLMSVGMFMAILDIQIVAASLSQIQAGLAASSDEIVWVQTSYLVAEVVMIPLSAFLARGLSTKNLFVISCAGFTLASLACATSNSITTMIIYRAIQGFIGGAMIPTVYSAAFIMFSPEGRARAMIGLGLVVTMAPTLGPVIGGWLTDNLSWHWLFLVNVVPGVLVTFGVWALGDFDKPNYSLLKRIDLLGLIAMALFFGGIEYVLEEGPRNDWLADREVLLWTALATIGCAVFFWRTRTVKEPIVRLHPFLSANFAAGTAMGAVMGVGLYGLTYIYPLYLARIAGFSSGQIGVTLFVTGLCMAITAPIAGNLIRVVDPRKMLCFAFLLLALSTWMTQGLTDQWRFWELFWPQVLRGVGLMCCIISISNTAFATLGPEDLKDAPGLFTLIRNLGGALGLALINTATLWRFNLHWGRLGEAINPGRVEVQSRLDAISALALSHGSADPDAAAVRQIAGEVSRQALVMTYADCFTGMTVMFLIVAVVPLLLKRPAVMGGPPGGGH